MAELLDRAQRLVAAGPYSASAADIAAVHAAIYPSREPVCQTCGQELGKAYYAIKRWADQQESHSSTSTSFPVKKTTVARFESDDTSYTPHGLGIVYTNKNLTDKAARNILKADPEAQALFSQLPPEAEEGEDEQPAAQAAEPVSAPVATSSEPQLDYDLLADKVAERLRASFTASVPTPTPAASASDNTDESGKSDNTSDAGSDNVQDESKPAPLSRANKEQLTALYTTELGQAPAPELSNDDLRKAIGDKRATNPQA